MTRDKNRHLKSRDALLAVLLTLASFILYTATAAPSVATLFDDSLEFQVVLPTLGIAHPSGYPLYTLLGRLFILLLPFRDPAGRANLLSALVAALTIGMLFLVARRIAGNRAAAAVATVAFAISPVWWSQATIAEVYALHGLLLVIFLYALLRWEETQIGRGQMRARAKEGEDSPPSPAPIRLLSQSLPREDRWLDVAALVAGLGMTHHRMIALVFPAALIFIFWTDPSLLRRPRRWIAPTVLFLTPLLLYLYLPIRGQAITSLDSTYMPTWRGTLDWLLARGYSVFLTGNPFGVSRDVGDYLALSLDQYGIFLLLGAVLGLVSAWRFSMRRYVFLLMATAVQVVFAVSYKVQDVGVFFIPTFVLTAIWAAWGLTPVFDGVAIYGAGLARQFRLPRWTRPFVLGGWTALLAALLLFQPVHQAVQSYPDQNRSRTWETYDYGQDIVASLAPGGQVVGLLGETTLVRYFRDVLGQRPDVSVVPADAEEARFTAIDTALGEDKPVYLTRDLPGAAARYSLDAAGPLIAVSAKPTPAPAPPGQPVGAGIRLADARTEVRQTHSGPAVRLNLAWTATGPVAEDLKVSARLVDQAGQVIVANDRVPVHFAYPTTAWVPGEIVQDVYDLALPPKAPPGPYGVLLILYRAADAGEVGRAELPPVIVERH